MAPFNCVWIVQVSTSITWDVVKGNLDTFTSLNILFKAPGQQSYGPIGATLPGAQLLRALCSAGGNHVALKVACSKV